MVVLSFQNGGKNKYLHYWCIFTEKPYIVNHYKVCSLYSNSNIKPCDVNDVKIKLNIGIKHGIPCYNVCQVPREMLKTEAIGQGFQHLPRDLANVNVLENNV